MIAIVTIDYEVDGEGYRRFYTNDTANYDMVWWWLDPSPDIGTSPGLSGTIVEADAIKESGAQSYRYGLIFLRQDSSNYARFLCLCEWPF